MKNSLRKVSWAGYQTLKKSENFHFIIRDKIMIQFLRSINNTKIKKCPNKEILRCSYLKENRNKILINIDKIPSKISWKKKSILKNTMKLKN
jgi:hypothetical protein